MYFAVYFTITQSSGEESNHSMRHYTNSLIENRSFRDIASPFIVLMGCILVGCGRTQPSAPIGAQTPLTGAKAGPFRIALILSGSSADHGWNQGAYEALKTVQQSLHLSSNDVSVKEQAVSADSQLQNLRAFASQGFTMVIGNGEEYEKPALRIAPDFPNTLFVIASGSQKARNVTPIVFKLEDGAYLEGMLAAGMSHTGKIAAIGGDPSAPVKSVLAAYALGAKAVNPGITVLNPIYTNDWEDVGRAKQAALALIGQGADVIIQDLDSAAQGVFDAVKQSGRPGQPVYALGTNSDQNSSAPDVILASATINVTPVFLQIATELKEGKYTPSNAPYGLKSGVIGFVYNPVLVNIIPAALKQKIEDAKNKIEAGTLIIPRAS